MKKFTKFIFLLGMILMIGCSTVKNQINLEEITLREIWSEEVKPSEKMFEYISHYHNAFTSLLFYRDTFYCSFRQGSDHGAGIDGVVRIIKSRDGKKWESVVTLKKQGYDLRDPKLSLTPDGKIMVIMGGSVWKDREIMSQLSHVSFSDHAGNIFSEPQPINIPTGIRSDYDWLWRVTWHNNTGYGVMKQQNRDNPEHITKKISLLETNNGVDYKLIKKFEGLGDNSTESTVRILPDGEMFMMVRRNPEGLWGRSKPPYMEWTWTGAGMRFGGPDFIQLNDNYFIAGARIYESTSGTGLFLVTKDGKFSKILRLPSGGDNSYPGLVIVKDKLYVSYYSSHEGRTNIYFAEIPLSVIEGMTNSPSTE